MAARSTSSEMGQHIVDLLRRSAVVVSTEEVTGIYLEDFGLGEYEETGLAVLQLVDTILVNVKIMILLPYQTCPEHRHRPVGDYPGKEETFRCQWGECRLYVPGLATPDPKATPPSRRRAHYTLRHEIVLRSGDQHTSAPNTWHWFQAGPEGAVVWSFCSHVVVGADEFRDRSIRGPAQYSLPKQAAHPDLVPGEPCRDPR